MTRPATDDPGESTAGPARARRDHLERDSHDPLVSLPGDRVRVRYADGDVATWQREGTTDWYRRVG